MAQVVGAISMSHAPGATGWPDTPKPDMRKRLDRIHAEVARYLDAAKPDVIIAFLDDHFENHFRNFMPSLAIGVASHHSGPAAQFLRAFGLEKVETLGGMPELAGALLAGLIKSGFDITRNGQVEYGNNLMTPLKLIRPQFDIAVVPIFINVFSPPLISAHRAYKLGEAVRTLVDQYPGNTRVLFLGTGGLSHWPPVWTEDSPEDDAFLQRMKRFQTEGQHVLVEDPNLFPDLAKYENVMAGKNQIHQHPIVNDEWDREIMDALGRGDVEYMTSLSYEEVHEKAGHGGHEILNWIATMGAMRGKPGHVVGYEPVIEWICGMGYLTYAA